ncbi:MAG: hypothetical protein ACREJT_04515, partial [Myxococcota bacterium]
GQSFPNLHDICSGGTKANETFGLNAPASDVEFSALRVFDLYPTGHVNGDSSVVTRVGASCTVRFESTGPAGTFSWVIESASLPPVGASLANESTGSSVLTYGPTPEDIPFIEEATNHRFLYAGTGGANFGTCQFVPDPPLGDDPPIAYSSATGPGWDCCTFQFDGIDGVPSSVGQLVFDVNGNPPPPDPDHDGFLSPCDSCDYKANTDQKDGGGVGNATPDGIGDACQCGRLTADSVVDAADVTALRAHLAANPVLSAAQLPFCSVIGGPTECTVRTATVLRRALAVPPKAPGVQQTCTAAQP